MNILGPTLKTETFDLSTVARELIGEEKIELDAENAWKMWDSGDVRKLCEYCLRDSELAIKIWNKLFPLMSELSKIVGRSLFDVSRMTYGVLVENYLIKEAPYFNELVPEKPKYEEVGKRFERTYEGGFVYQPSPGLYENIIVLDFRSIYPSIIVTYNICPSTINCECCKDEAIEIDGERYVFCKKRKGFISSVIKELIDRRNRIKEIIKSVQKDSQEFRTLNARSYAIKTIANAMYGYLGFSKSRWYCLECAKAITAIGRYHLKELIKDAKDIGMNVIYGDTDSIIISSSKKEEGIKFLNYVNKKLPGIMRLELQGFYPRGIFVSKRVGKEGAKKKYALIDENGEILIRGFEYVRRNASHIAKKTQMEVLKAILKENSKEKAVEIVKETIRKLRKHEIPIDEVAIHTQLTKDISAYSSIGPHVAAARRAMKMGYYVGPGTIIKWIVVKGKGKIGDKARLSEEVKRKKLEYDEEYYINHQVIPSVIGIFEVLGYKKEDLVVKKQETLKKFF